MLAAKRPNEPTRQTATLAAGSAAGLAALDHVYVAKRTISPVYLLDGLVELALVGAWALLRPRARGH